MSWFKVHSDDLHKIEKHMENAMAESRPVEYKPVKTKDVIVYVARYNDECMSYFSGRKYIRGDVMTKTDLRDAFVKAAIAIAEHPDFDPKYGYTIRAEAKVISEPVDD